MHVRQNVYDFFGAYVAQIKYFCSIQIKNGEQDGFEIKFQVLFRGVTSLHVKEGGGGGGGF